ncbi:hypothetical protein [Nocardia cyriacigeorgica]|uniref:hypothetical protein n=2 Tax=Nocardia cyriacigeorgica TaxID=135487 RepID=UPI002458344E|nr:hypothetical protein [Nocardia cyriacigeorgica]
MAVDTVIVSVNPPGGRSRMYLASIFVTWLTFAALGTTSLWVVWAAPGPTRVKVQRSLGPICLLSVVVMLVWMQVAAGW